MDDDDAELLTDQQIVAQVNDSEGNQKQTETATVSRKLGEIKQFKLKLTF